MSRLGLRAGMGGKVEDEGVPGLSWVGDEGVSGVRKVRRVEDGVGLDIAGLVRETV